MAAEESLISQAVLLVGGLGTRLRPLTYRTPKALLPVLNRPLVSYELELLGRHGVAEAILTAAYHAQQLRSALGTGRRWGPKLVYVEEQRPLDTAGAIKNAEKLIQGDFFALNGDLILDCNLTELAQAHQESGAVVTILLRRVADISHFGLIQRDERGFITAFREKATEDETAENTVNAGVYVMNPEVLDYIPPGRPYSNETDLFPTLLEKGLPMYGHLPTQLGYWTDVGRLETYLAAHRDLLRGGLPWLSWADCSAEVAEPGTVIEPPTCCGPNGTIGAGAKVGPYVTLGAGVQVGAAAVLRDCIIHPGATIGAAAQVESAVVAENEIVPEGYHQSEGVFCTEQQRDAVNDPRAD